MKGLLSRKKRFNGGGHVKCSNIATVLFSLLAFTLIAGCSSLKPTQTEVALFILEQREDSRTAWNVIFEEMRHFKNRSKKNQCQDSAVYLEVLGNIAITDYIPPNSDDLIEKSYRFLQDNCSGDVEKIIKAENAYGRYYFLRKQSGLAINHIQRAIKLSQSNSVSRFVSEANLGDCYSDMGKYALRDHYLGNAIKSGRAYFLNNPRQLTYEYYNQVVKYCSILEARLNHLSEQRNKSDALKEMHRIWEELEPFIQRWHSISFQFKYYLKPIRSFAIAGDIPLSKKLFDDIRALNRLYPYKQQDEAEIEFVKLEAIILEAEGSIEKAVKLNLLSCFLQKMGNL